MGFHPAVDRVMVVGMFILLMVEAAALSVYSYVQLSGSWVAMLCLWFAGVAFQRTRGWTQPQTPSGRLRVLWFAGSAGFPLIATWWQRYQLTHRAMANATIPNRLQHLFWSGSLVWMLLPMLTTWWPRQPGWAVVAMSMCAVALLGNAAELVEWVADRSLLQHDARLASLRLTDTMLDITMNIIGSAIAAVAAAWCHGGRRVDYGDAGGSPPREA